MLFVYLLENPNYSLPAQLLLENTLVAGDKLLTSSLILGEAMVGIQRLNDARALSLRRMLFALPFEVVDFRSGCIDSFVALRNRGVKAPDAMNLACAESAGTDVFVTNDKGLRARTLPLSLQVLPLDEALNRLF